MKRREWIGSLTALAFSGLSAYANKKAEFLPKILLQEEEKQTESCHILRKKNIITSRIRH